MGGNMKKGTCELLFNAGEWVEGCWSNADSKTSAKTPILSLNSSALLFKHPHSSVPLVALSPRGAQEEMVYIMAFFISWMPTTTRGDPDANGGISTGGLRRHPIPDSQCARLGTLCWLPNETPGTHVEQPRTRAQRLQRRPDHHGNGERRKKKVQAQHPAHFHYNCQQETWPTKQRGRMRHNDDEAKQDNMRWQG